MPVISLEYHDVVRLGAWDSSGYPGAAAASYKLDEVVFAEHLATLAMCGRPVGGTVSDAVSATTDGVLLTFDDGGSSAEQFIPLLDARGWRAHLFVVSSRVGSPGFLTGTALRALHASGHVIGSHSATHPARMNQMTRDALREEWANSVEALSDLLGARVEVASVPGGFYGAAVADEAAAAGVRVLFTSEPQVGFVDRPGCRVLGRFTLRQHHGATYVSRLVAASGHARAAQWLHWNVKKIGKLAAGSLYARLRDVRYGDG